MKVIGIDNFGRDTISDYLVKENLTPEEAEKIVGELNQQSGYSGSRFYKAVEDDYVLYRWEP